MVANYCTISDIYVALDGTPQQNLSVTATPTYTPLFVQFSGVYDEVTYSSLSGTTDSNGAWSINLPYPSICDPSSVKFQLRLPDGTIWQGTVPSVAGPLSVKNLKDTYSWSLVAAGTNLTPISAVSGPQGPAGPTGPTGPAGSVTSVAMTVPTDILSVSGSPITGSGTLAVSKANQTANTVFAGPTSGGAAAPTMRALVDADMPAHVPLLNVDDVFTGKLTGTALIASGLTGATSASRYVGATASSAPASGTFAVGDFVITQTGKIYICTGAGTPGTWALANLNADTTLTSGSSTLALAADGTIQTSNGTAPTVGSLGTSVSSTAFVTGKTANHGLITITWNGTAYTSGNTLFRLTFPTAYSHAPAIFLTWVLLSTDTPQPTGSTGGLPRAINVTASLADVCTNASFSPTNGQTGTLAYWIIGD